MQQVQEYAGSVLTYTIALLSMYAGEVAGFLGFVLLIARLVQEVPKAWAVITGQKVNKDND